METIDPERVARLVAEGALAPLSAPTRFELAVVIRLVRGVWDHLRHYQPGQWTFSQNLVASNRRDIALFEHEDGARVRVFYDQAVLDPGFRDCAMHHYFGVDGRLRPDITCLVERPGVPTRACVVEVKLSPNLSYLMGGFAEAVVYRWEYADKLTGWPKSILVTPEQVSGLPRVDDDVIAIPWERWVPDDVLAGLLA